MTRLIRFDSVADMFKRLYPPMPTEEELQAKRLALALQLAPDHGNPDDWRPLRCANCFNRTPLIRTAARLHGNPWCQPCLCRMGHFATLTPLQAGPLGLRAEPFIARMIPRPLPASTRAEREWMLRVMTRRTIKHLRKARGLPKLRDLGERDDTRPRLPGAPWPDGNGPWLY
jgi:hypothetical protein